MAKIQKPQVENESLQQAATAEDAFEMIELAIDDIDLLTRAFEVINEACAELEDSELESDTPPRMIIN
jgi:hypothetical protein